MPVRVHVAGRQGPSPDLVGRHQELAVLRSFVADVRAGRGRVLVMVGDPGTGKTALFEHLRAGLAGCRMETGSGVESEMELPFAGLHQLLAPMLGGMRRLPAPQREALQAAFGISAGPAPDGFLIALATLSLLSDYAEAEPLCCFVDDLHWLDRASARVLSFAGRRLRADSVGLLFATRARLPELAGFDELSVGGLAEPDARLLLDSVLTTPLDPRVRDRVIAEAGGNPLALLELFRGLTAADLAGGFGLGALPVTASLENEFSDRLDALPAATRTLLLVAAADPVGDPALVFQAAAGLGIEQGAAAVAVEAGLVSIGTTVRFRHPLVRSAAYRSATNAQRQAAHRALARATDPALDPDRRAWHRAQATAGLDEDVARELEESAGRAQARGGLTATAAFLQKAFEFTADPGRRAERALAAAQAKVRSGAAGDALALLVAAEGGPLTELDRARADLVRAQAAFASRRGSDASQLLLHAARRLEQVDLALARATYLDALVAGTFAGQLAQSGADVRAVAQAALALPAPPRPSVADLLLEGCARNFVAGSFGQGYAAGMPFLRRAIADFGDGVPADQALRWLQLAYGLSAYTWDDAANQLLGSRWVTLVRDLGALSELPIALTGQILTHVFEGQLGAAAGALEELRAAAEAAQTDLFPHAPMALAAYRGDLELATQLISAAIADATERGEGMVVASASWASAVLHNGLGHYPEALAAARQATADPWILSFHNWGLVELIEAAAHLGSPELATEACAELTGLARSAGTSWALGNAARSQAQLAHGEQAEACYRTAIELLASTRVQPDHARARLLYGEWLRRENRRADAREQLRTAYEMLSAMGLAGFAERARRELLATGETVRKRAAPAGRQLTPQEASIARLAAEGLTSNEIGTRLFISSRTVQYHLAKVFQKLEITSRGQLHRVLPRG
jgi:DNA-binding CsgD family transcriptional regulator